ncbi:MAG: hypothetical protein M1831_002368 [Alyxoria varia]|nr:MAG: hypothetical protein M1831_002368 [Alyxoria varia]
MSGSSIDEDAALRQFDQLLHDGELFWAQTAPMLRREGELVFDFRIVPSFKNKPQLSTDQPLQKSEFDGSKNNSSPLQTAQSAHRPSPSDGSDIDHSDPAFFVSYISPQSSEPATSNDASRASHPTHKLILNKFNVYRPQFLLLTTDPLARQYDALDEADLKAAWSILLGSLTSQTSAAQYYVIYNCGKEGGSSRLHKHMQVLMDDIESGSPHKSRMDGEERGIMWPHVSGRADEICEALVARLEHATHDTDSRGANTASDDEHVEVHTLPDVPYAHSFTPLLPSSHSFNASLAHLVAAYKKHMSQCRIDISLKDSDKVPHNFILTPSFLLTIPRRKATAEGIAGHVVNATGMMGCVWCANEEQLQGWKDTGFSEVLRQLGVAR